VSKLRTPRRHAKTDLRYWEQAVFQPTYTKGGETKVVGEWSAKIQHAGRRETFGLNTANRSTAGEKAKKIYLSLLAGGWEATLAVYKPKAAKKFVVTIGDFLGEVKVRAAGHPKTIEGYCRCFRSIVADIFGIDGGTTKYDYRTGGRAKWIANIEAVKLADVTPQRVQEWKLRFLRRAGSDPTKQRAAKISVNSAMRQAKSLFTPTMREFVALDLPHGTPFDGVKFEKRQNMKYRGGFNVAEVIRLAVAELPLEQLKIFLLAVMAGLRRNEIDKLEWPAFRWAESLIRIETSRFFHPKSEDSLGDVQVDAEVMEIFRGYHKAAKMNRGRRAGADGDFVISSKNPARLGANYEHYRAEREFAALAKWLRAHGVVSDRPLHTLRKEYGSQICAKHGIYAASHALRHADINITSQHYLDSKKRVTAGMGHLLQGVGSGQTEEKA
jgi:integrase